MLKMSSDRQTHTEVTATGDLETLCVELATAITVLTDSMMEPFSTDAELMHIEAMIFGACMTGIKAGAKHHKKEAASND